MIFFQLLATADNGADREGFERMIRSEAAEWVVEKCSVKLDEQSICVRASFSLIDGEHADQHSSRDISNHNEAEEKRLYTRDHLLEVANKRAEALSSLSRYLMCVSEEEKASLARELHDEIGSSLAAVSMDMNWILNKLKQSNPELATRQERALAGIHAALDIKRRIVDGLRPLALEHFGLDVALRAHCDAFAEKSGLSITLDFPENMPPPDPATSLVVFRVVQECLDNIVKHAGASRVRVELEKSATNFAVRVHDDGKGYFPELIDRLPTHGILGMRERLAHLGGTLSILPGPSGKGTVVEALLPSRLEIS